MKEKKITPSAKGDNTTPDEMMDGFRGKSLKSIVVFTVIIHAIILLGTSVPFILEKVSGKDTSKISEEERRELAVKKATESLREIADEYGMNVQELSSKFLDGKKASKTPVKEPVKKTPQTVVEPDNPESIYKKQLDVKANGPEVPKVEDNDEDLFK